MYDLITKDRDIHVLPFDFENTEDVKSVYLLSDIHFDSIKCDRKLFFKHLDRAKEENAVVLILGDLYDLMNMKFDPRGSYDSLRPELKAMAYIDEVIKDCSPISSSRIRILSSSSDRETTRPTSRNDTGSTLFNERWAS